MKYRFSAKILFHLQKPAQSSAINGIAIRTKDVSAAAKPEAFERLQGDPFCEALAQRIVDPIVARMVFLLPGVAVFVSQDGHRHAPRKKGAHGDLAIVVETLHSVPTIAHQLFRIGQAQA